MDVRPRCAVAVLGQQPFGEDVGPMLIQRPGLIGPAAFRPRGSVTRRSNWRPRPEASPTVWTWSRPRAPKTHAATRVSSRRGPGSRRDRTSAPRDPPTSGSRSDPGRPAAWPSTRPPGRRPHPTPPGSTGTPSTPCTDRCHRSPAPPTCSATAPPTHTTSRPADTPDYERPRRPTRPPRSPIFANHPPQRTPLSNAPAAPAPDEAQPPHQTPHPENEQPSD